MQIRLFIFSLFIASAASAEVNLDQSLNRLRFEDADLPVVLQTIARATDTTILFGPEVEGAVTLEINAGTLGQALDAITFPLGYFFEVREKAVVVGLHQTVLYAIDYPQLTRSGSGSASITLGGNQSGEGQSVANRRQNLNNLAGGSADATQVSISQENPNTFWISLESELRTMLQEDESLVLNRFSGVLQITATRARHKVLRAFIDLVNKRISQQVEIEARLVEVTLRDEQKLGVDWDLAATTVNGTTVEGSAPLEVAGVGGTLLSGHTFSANLGFGEASAVIHALQQQGEVTTVAQPRLRALNNQTAFIKVGEDRPFFRLQQSTTFQQSGTTVPFNQTQESFSVSTITIGTILAVTPQIDHRGVITLDVLPAITRLQSIITSPDGKQTAPVTEVKQASTIVRLRDGETAIIGGLISEETGSSQRAVPVLGKIPVLGAAFRSEASLRSRTELVIFLTPRLVP
jgi:MSHA biogenesis protein MshL